MHNPFKRRIFLRQSTLLAGAALFGLPPWAQTTPVPIPMLSKDATIREVIDRIIALCGPAIEPTVDTVKSGDPDKACTGIVTTFLATAEVIQRTAAEGANLIITHEPTFYNHLDQTDWLREDPVYRFKRGLLEKHGIVVWRFHDYWHQHEPDGILEGFLKAVGWKPYLDKDRDFTCVIPETSLRELAHFLKGQLQLRRTFYTGDPDLRCRHIALLPGAWGREKQLEALRRKDIEVIVVGEVAEWETCEWVRDATTAGLKKGLIVLGHADSEEPGMHFLAEWLQPNVSGIPVRHIPAEDPFVPV